MIAVYEHGLVEIVDWKQDSVISTRNESRPMSFCCQNANFIFSLSTNSIDMIPLESPEDWVRLNHDDGLSDVEWASCHWVRNELILVEKNRGICIYNIDMDTRALKLVQRLVDKIERKCWKYAGFSHQLDFESSHFYTVARSAGNHEVCIWNVPTCTMVQAFGTDILERVGLALWHPQKWQLLTVGAETGHVYIWGPEFAQSWSALVANIDPIDCNVEYCEVETEFDLFSDSCEEMEPISFEAFFQSVHKSKETIIWPIN